MSRKKSDDDEAGAIDLTPMLDVVFIMLIFFIVTASFIKEPGIEVNRPDASMPDEVKTPILVAIAADDKVWINKNEVDDRQIMRQIQQLYAETPKGKVVIQADRDSTIEKLAEVARAAREAGVAEITISADKE